MLLKAETYQEAKRLLPAGLIMVLTLLLVLLTLLAVHQ